MTNVLRRRPINGQSESTAGIFKLVDAGSEAIRTQVKFGRTSVSTISIVDGLKEGHQIITSDMGQWDVHNRIRLK
jgi:hypothetical protein